MGATDFHNVHRTQTDPKKAFDELVADSRYRHGHDTYSGVIATKNEYTVIQRIPMELDDAEEMARDLLDKDDRRIDKWGPALAIRVKGDGVDGWYFFGLAPC